MIKINKDFKDIEYLKEGNTRKQRSYEILKKINIFNLLSKYNPILVGTIPIDIDIENSDLDIVCKVEDFRKFEELLIKEFSKYKEFKVTYKASSRVIICNFKVENMEIEIYGSKLDTDKTNSYRHMIIEYRLLNLLGDDFKAKIIDLKKQGLKTEPAFSQILKLKGNPYEELLLFEQYDDEKLLEKMDKSKVTFSFD
ncbi:DUF4269 domain-containing protein [Tepidibacter hydrothermalis]|uniref:DUF4269 domain-containing protein n=1 Tax=Tepidibacter hydrothermalis TaxID=3036126 RepID=A0ABY8EJC2_9FIRM|nr:DUF4269 domain-containing protein [Tepidibacter hydrothermalis]WFD11884.1 DUF4269 domain-containing protein [Tepidibacter hydrothermalis]